MTKLKNACAMSLALFALLLLIGCTSSPPDEAQILKDLQAEDFSYVVEVATYDILDTAVTYVDHPSKVTITKRQTNEKSDTVYCTVEMDGSGALARTLHLVLDYNYYDQGGWILDGYSQNMTADVTPLIPGVDDWVRESAEMRYAYVSPAESTLTEDGRTKITYEIASRCDSYYQYGTKTYYMELTASHTNKYSWKWADEEEDITVDWDIIGVWTAERSGMMTTNMYANIEIVSIDDENITANIYYDKQFSSTMNETGLVLPYVVAENSDYSLVLVFSFRYDGSDVRVVFLPYSASVGGYTMTKEA